MSLSDLIYNYVKDSQESPSSKQKRRIKHEEHDEDHSLPLSLKEGGLDQRRQKQRQQLALLSSSSFLRSSIEQEYTYDPIDDYYREDQPGEKLQSTNRNKVVSDDDDNNDNQNADVDGHDGADRTSSTNAADTRNGNWPSQGKTNYDFQRNEENRDFFNLTDKQQIHDGELGTRRKRRGQQQQENETKEEYMERMERHKIAQSRRKRFRDRKFNFENEIDYNGSIARMVYINMNASDRQSMKKKRLDSSGLAEYVNNLENDDMDMDVNMDVDTQDDSTTGEKHVLGSLLDHIQKQEDELIRQRQQQRIQIEDDEIIYNENEMERNPLSFLREGYVAPLPIDPNMQQYSYRCHRSPNSKLNKVRANKTFQAEQNRARKKFGKINTTSPQVSQHGPMVKQKKSTSRRGEFIARHFLPLNCFNPNMARLNYPNHRDTYHYLPITRQDPPTSLRINTAKATTSTYLKQMGVALFNDSKESFYQRKNKSFIPLHFHSRNIHLLAARFIVCCAGIKEQDENTSDVGKGYRNSNDLNISNKNDLSRFLEMLHRTRSTSSRTSMLIYQCQEMASNYAMWQHLQTRIKTLHDKKHLDDEEYYFLRKELLSEKSEMFVDPHATSDGKDLTSSATRNRKKIWDSIKNLENIVHEHYDDQEEVHGETNLDGRIDSAGEENGDSMDTDGATNSDEKELLPYRPFFSLQKGIKYSASPLTSSLRGEKYSEVVHTSQIDLDTIRLTLAALYAELSLHRSRFITETPSLSSSNISGRKMKDQIEEIHETIMTYFEFATNNIWYIGNNAKAGSGHFYKNLLNGPLATTILMRQSYVANGGSFDVISTQNALKSESMSFESSSDDVEAEEEKQITYEEDNVMTDFRSIAEELYSFGSKLRGDSKLLIFTEIHLTTGVAMIARNLPSYAAEIISRPLIQYNQTQQSPFDLLRLALTAMERKKAIKRNQRMTSYLGDEEDMIEVNFLIETLNKAAEIFYDCVERDPTNLDCMSWYVAVRTGAMIVGSGILIGSGPCLAARPDYLLEDATNPDLRCRHSDYSNLRAACSEAIRELISWQNRAPHPGQGYHYAIKSFLEWDEVIFLLSFRPLINPGCFRKICLLHASHAMAWASHDRSTDSLKILSSCHDEGLITKNQLLSFLSVLVESDATNAKCWVMLACALGPLGSKDIECKDLCSDKNCAQCKRLGSGRFNHKKLKRLQNKHDWWGKDPSGWWENLYFFIPQADRFTKKDIDLIATTTGRIQTYCRGRQPISTLSGNKIKRVEHNFTDVSWMWPAEPSEEDEEDAQSSDSESGSESDISSITDNQNKNRVNKFLSLLPGGKVEDNSDAMIDALFDNMDNECSILASKVLVVCHLYGTDHTFLEGAIKYLWKTGQSESGYSDSIKALSFMVIQNLDIFSFIKDARKEHNLRRRGNAALHTDPFPFRFAAL